jgi:hypothetical protein
MREIRTAGLMSGEETGRASDTAPFLDSSERLQLAQIVRDAQRMKHAVWM